MSPGYLPSEVQGVTMLRESAEVWDDYGQHQMFLACSQVPGGLFPAIYQQFIFTGYSFLSENLSLLSWWYILKRSSLLLFWTSSSLSSFVNGFHSSPTVTHPWMLELAGKVHSITGGHWESLSMSINRHECIEKDMKIISVEIISFYLSDLISLKVVCQAL